MKKEETIFQELKHYRLRLTKTRKAFIEVLSARKHPLSAAQILEELKKKAVNVNKTTVYRELERLEKIGIVESVQLNDRKRYYELSARDHHHHLVCMQCEKVEDVDVEEHELMKQENEVGKQKKFVVIRHSLEFFGLCEKCHTVNI